LPDENHRRIADDHSTATSQHYRPDAAVRRFLRAAPLRQRATDAPRGFESRSGATLVASLGTFATSAPRSNSTGFPQTDAHLLAVEQPQGVVQPLRTPPPSRSLDDSGRALCAASSSTPPSA
jgi:hypothetical protein